MAGNQQIPKLNNLAKKHLKRLQAGKNESLNRKLGKILKKFRYSEIKTGG